MPPVIAAVDTHSTAYQFGQWCGTAFVIVLIAWVFYFFVIKKRPPKIYAGTRIVTTRAVGVVGLIHWLDAPPSTFKGVLPPGVRFVAPAALPPKSQSFYVMPEIPAIVADIAFSPEQRERYANVPLSVLVQVEGFDKAWRISI